MTAMHFDRVDDIEDKNNHHEKNGQEGEEKADSGKKGFVGQIAESGKITLCGRHFCLIDDFSCRVNCG